MATKQQPCYVCNTKAVLSPRSRCVVCEHERAVFNEAENEELRARIDALESQLPFRERVRAYGIAHPHETLRMAREGATLRDGTLVVPR